MADITMCNNPNCSLKRICFRHRATPSEYQAFFIIDKVVNSEEDCNSFWSVVDDEELKELNRIWRDL